MLHVIHRIPNKNQRTQSHCNKHFAPPNICLARRHIKKKNQTKKQHHSINIYLQDHTSWLRHKIEACNFCCMFVLEEDERVPTEFTDFSWQWQKSWGTWHWWEYSSYQTHLKLFSSSTSCLPYITTLSSKSFSFLSTGCKTQSFITSSSQLLIYTCAPCSKETLHPPHAYSLFVSFAPLLPSSHPPIYQLSLSPCPTFLPAFCILLLQSS